MASVTCALQEQSNKAESLVRLHDGMVTAAEALGRLAGEELRGAQAEHLEEEAAARVRSLFLCCWIKAFMHFVTSGCTAKAQIQSALTAQLTNRQRENLLKLWLLLFMNWSLFL